ncbi:MAG: hypothetical protein SNG27_09965 [Rikenellaceae bacterium]
MKYKRVIQILSDGRRKYSTFKGEILQWSQNEIDSLAQNIDHIGYAAYTLDFMCYDVEAKELRRRYPRARIVKVVGFEVEDHDLPINPNVIY